MLVQTSNERGQSLLEVTITLGIALVLIIALTITTIQGLQTSQLSQNQIQATKYAQEGLERVKILRNNNVPVSIGSKSCYWYAENSATTLIWSGDCSCSSPNSNPCVFKYNTQPSNGFYNLTEITNQVDITNSSEAIEIFKRRIEVTDLGTNRKKFTSIVTWIDQSGSHESRLETILSNY